MSTQLLAQAVATVYNEHSTSQQLVDALGDLVTFGAFDAVDEAIRRLREQDKAPLYLIKLERLVNWLRRLGPQFEETRLAGAIVSVGDPLATNQQLLKAAECLVVWGSLDHADRALSQLRLRKAFPGPTERLTAASRQLRRSGILQELQTLTPETSLNKPYEVLLRRKPGAKRVIIVFTGIAFRFWLSLNALHLFLRKLDAHVIYLSDHHASMFVNGIGSVGFGYDKLLAMLREQLRELDPRTVYILATSAGGFVGLRAAMDLKAECFAGMSIRTTLDPGSPIQTSPFERYVIQVCRYPEMLIDLRPMVEASEYPRRIQLYCGDHNKIDIAHARNLAGIPRVEVRQIPGYRLHDAISGLIARGHFQHMLRDFVSGPAAAPSTVEAS